MLPLTQKLRIVNGRARSGTEAVMVFQLDSLATDPDHPHAAIYHLVDGTATRLGRYEFNVVSTDFTSDGTIFALGEWGEVRRFAGGAEAEETIDVARGPLRCLRVLDDQVFACGASLQVWRRSGAGLWTEMSPPADLRAEFPDAHLEQLDGFGPSEIYAAGSTGVIWWYDGAEWTPVQCPTNASFYCLTCGADGKVYASGQSGIVVVGRTDSFELLEHGTPVNDIWGIAKFRELVYLSGFQAMLTLKDTELDLEETAMLMSQYFYDLSPVDGFLWSFGMKTVLRFDGVGWDRITDVTVQ